MLDICREFHKLGEKEGQEVSLEVAPVCGSPEWKLAGLSRATGASVFEVSAGGSRRGSGLVVVNWSPSLRRFSLVVPVKEGDCLSQPARLQTYTKTIHMQRRRL